MSEAQLIKALEQARAKNETGDTSGALDLIALAFASFLEADKEPAE